MAHLCAAISDSVAGQVQGCEELVLLQCFRYLQKLAPASVTYALGLQLAYGAERMDVGGWGWGWGGAQVEAWQAEGEPAGIDT